MSRAPRVFCLSHAGGSSAAFGSLRAALRPELEVIALDLPGHGRRLGEAFCATVHECAVDVVAQLDGRLTSSDVLLGHSLGSWVAYEAALQIQRAGGTLPQLVVLSGNTAPPSQADPAPIAGLPDESFLERIGRLGNLPPVIFDNPELSAIFLPILRRDYDMIARYERAVEPLDVPVLVLLGREDVVTAAPEREWSGVTRNLHVVEEFDGGHFFLYERAHVVSTVIKDHYRNCA